MKNLTSVLIFTMLVIGLISYSNCTTPIDGGSTNLCPPPSNFGISGIEPLSSTNNYVINYEWSPVSNATLYKFSFSKNGEQIFTTDTETTTQPVTTSLELYDTLQASVSALCSIEGVMVAGEASTSTVLYLNAITTDDIVFRMNRESDVNTICQEDCNYIWFKDSSVLDDKGNNLAINTVISPLFVYYSYSDMKNCLCNNRGGAVITEVMLNNCMASSTKVILTDPTFCN